MGAFLAAARAERRLIDTTIWRSGKAARGATSRAVSAENCAIRAGSWL
jgi:hypothetical protein